MPKCRQVNSAFCKLQGDGDGRRVAIWLKAAISTQRGNFFLIDNQKRGPIQGQGDLVPMPCRTSGGIFFPNKKLELFLPAAIDIVGDEEDIADGPAADRAVPNDLTGNRVIAHASLIELPVHVTIAVGGSGLRGKDDPQVAKVIQAGVHHGVGEVVFLGAASGSGLPGHLPGSYIIGVFGIRIKCCTILVTPIPKVVYDPGSLQYHQTIRTEVIVNTKNSIPVIVAGSLVVAVNFKAGGSAGNALCRQRVLSQEEKCNKCTKDFPTQQNEG